MAISLTALIGIAATCAVTVAVIAANDRIAQLAFVKEANDSLQAIQVQIGSAKDALYGLRDLFDSSDDPVSRGEFQAFAKRFRERFAGLRDTGWAPRITKDQRLAFEHTIQNQGFPAYEIKAREGSSQPKRAPERDFYFPILYPDPVAVGPKVMGVDLSFETLKGNALFKSIRTQEPASTPPLSLISGAGGINGFMSFLPVFGPDGSTGDVRGAVYGVFEIAPMIERVLKFALRSHDISLYFYDAQQPSDTEAWVYWHPAADGSASSTVPERSGLLDRPHWEGTLHIMDQTWKVLFIPEHGIGKGIWQWPVLVAVGVGLAITAMIEVFLLVSMRRTAELERLTVQLRTTASTLEKEGEKLAHVARHDSLTGLPNRMAFAKDIQRITPDETGTFQIAALMLDLDRFKAVNDNLGHAAGDMLLCEVADRLRENLRPEDIVARLGGDEFVVVQVKGAQPRAAEALAGRLVDVLSRPYRIMGHEVEIGVSIGIAIAQIPETNMDRMLRQADLALYDAKDSGRGTWRFSAMPRELPANETQPVRDIAS